jgi:alkylation response protein AidB-like acyl-CoA dehydrogenase
MDFDLSEDQLALQSGARELLDARASSVQLRAHTETDAGYDAALWSAMADQGWLGIEVEESRGGVGLGAVEVAVLCEELGRHAAPAPFLSTVLAIDAFGAAGEDEWVDRLVSGDALACVAWDATAPVPYAPSADVAVVIADGGVYAMEMSEHPRRQPPRHARGSSTAARRSARRICWGARHARSTWRWSTPRTGCSSVAPSARSKP